MRTLLIVYHSVTGGTRQMAAAQGAGVEPQAGVRLMHAPDPRPADVLAADGYAFARESRSHVRADGGLLRPRLLRGAGAQGR